MSAPIVSPLPPEVAAPHEGGSPPSAVAVVALGKVYEPRPVLRNVAFNVAPGRTLALLGPNGAGKTTLLRILATLVKPSAGRAAVAGLDVRRDAAAIRRVVGYVGHQPHVYEDLTARENLVFFARMYGLRDGASRADALLARVGLRARASDRVRTLSRGQAQRLALARGILHAPAVLLLDEPDTGLDDEAAAVLDSVLAERTAAGATTIVTTHSIPRALAVAGEALVLVAGRVAYRGPARELSVAAVRALYGRKAG